MLSERRGVIALFAVLATSAIAPCAQAEGSGAPHPAAGPPPLQHPDTLRVPPAPAPTPAEPPHYRMDDFRKPVPATLAGAKVIDTEAAERLWEKKAAVFIDVFPKPHKPVNLPAGTLWIDPKHDTIPGAHWVPNVGYGALPAESETYFRSTLEALTERAPDKPLVFFCLRDCWMSWNAAKRAMEWGYKNVVWYPEGTDGWQEAGNELDSLASEGN
jgi:PQQ-dependent catabolism-associated CXXCW motif protein